MADCAVVVSGKYRKIVQIAPVKSGKYSEGTDIPAVVGGKYREGWVAFKPHIASGYYSTDSQSDVVGWTVDRKRISTALNKGYTKIRSHELQVVSGQLLWDLLVTFTDDHTERYSLPTPPYMQPEVYTSIDNTMKSIQLVYSSNNGSTATGTGEFDFSQ